MFCYNHYFFEFLNKCPSLNKQLKFKMFFFMFNGIYSEYGSIELPKPKKNYTSKDFDKNLRISLLKNLFKLFFFIFSFSQFILFVALTETII